MRVPLGMYRVAKDAKPSHRWEGIVLRSDMFRNAKHAQRQCVRSNSECRITKNHRNHLNNNVLRKHTENCVFRPNSSVKEKKCVVFTIDCWLNSRSSNIGHNASTWCLRRLLLPRFLSDSSTLEWWRMLVSIYTQKRWSHLKPKTVRSEQKFKSSLNVR